MPIKAYEMDLIDHTEDIMLSEQLAAGYLAYVSTDEVEREAAEPADVALREPTSFISTACIHSAHCGDDES